MLRIGTSGWQYRDWRPGRDADGTGYLYPAGLPQRAWLEHYAARFGVVEVNNAFYRLPERDTFARWRDQTPDGFRFAVKMSREPRHPSWFTPECEELLRRHRAALCWADRRGRPVTPLWRTADFGYLRLHEGAGKPWPRYGRAALRSWLDRSGIPEMLVFFNNDPGGAAVIDAGVMAAEADRRGIPIGPVPRIRPRRNSPSAGPDKTIVQ